MVYKTLNITNHLIVDHFKPFKSFLNSNCIKTKSKSIDIS